MAHQNTYGARAEDLVVAHLHNTGYTVCTRNYTTRHGEIDIIARIDDTYAFIEVKARTTPRFAISDTITARKQAKIIRTAQQYMHAYNVNGYNARFDVALVTGSQDVSYITHAFAPEDVIS